MIKVEHISKNFGSLKVLDDFTLEFPEGKITAILGPSGCGKTTILNILAGLVKVDQGNLITTENVSYLFQEPRLLPWLTIKQNIVLVLQDKMSAQEVHERIAKNLKTTGLMDYANYYPAQLSGGMRQRVAMARAFSYDAPLLLMDEPFKSLDIKTRVELIANFLKLWCEAPRTVVTVTHDVKEAVMLGNEVIVLSKNPARVNYRTEISIIQNERDNYSPLISLEQELFNLLLR